MVKRSKKTINSDLMVDVIDYAFTEWLVRRELFSAFKANFDVAFSPRISFRDRLRIHIRRSFDNPLIGPKDLIYAAFVFNLTPEGSDFWTKQAAAWVRFYSRFQTKY